MPTLVTRYVDTRSPAGGNGTTPSTGSGDANRAYANLSASLAAESSSRGNLVSRDELLKIECTGGPDTGSNTHEPRFITDESRYLWITANSSSRSNGVWDGSKYTVSGPTNLTSVFRIDFIKNLFLEGLQIENRTPIGTYVIINLTDSITQGRTLKVVDCYLRATSGSETGGVGGTVGPAISYTYAIRKSLTMVNTIIHGKFSHGIYASDALSGSNFAFYNNTIYDVSGSGVDIAFASLTTASMYNNIIMSYRPNVLAYQTSSGNGNFFGNNISSDNSSPSTNLRNINIQFANPVAGDFRITDRLSPAINAGFNLTNDVLYPFTTDIAGNIRGVGKSGRSWDIGALEYQRPSTIVSTNTLSSFSDDFNRADGGLGSNWLTTTSGVYSGSSLRIASNAVVSDSPGGANVLNSASLIFSPDQEAELTLSARGTFDYIGAGVRMGLGFTGYALAIDGRETTYAGVVRCDGSTFSQIATGAWVVSEVGDTYRIRIVGNRITVFRNNVFATTFTDNTYSNGQPGILYIRDNFSTTKGDNFIAKDLRNSTAWSTTGTRGQIIGSSTWG